MSSSDVASVAALAAAGTLSETSLRPARRGSHAAFIAHWRGELPLVRSFWLCGVVPALLAAVAAGALAALVDVTTGSVRLAALGALIAWPGALVLLAWCGVGVWRSAGAQLRQRGRALAAYASRIAVALAAAAAVASTALHFSPRCGELARLAAGHDPAGEMHLRPSADGHRLQLQGPLADGAAARLQDALAASPQARLLELDAPGGRFAEALAIADALRGQGWTIRVVGTCADACMIVFMAGSVREIAPDGRVRVGRMRLATANPLVRWFAWRSLGATYRGAGLPDSLVRKALAMPPGYGWRPDRGETETSGIVTMAAHPFDVALPAWAGAAPQDYADALRANAVWHRLERRHPGSIAIASERMRASRDSGADNDAVLLAGQRVIESLLPKLLFDAGPELREQYAQLLLQQLNATRSAAGTCQRLLAGDAAARRALPAALAQREAAWVLDAAAEPPRTSAAREARAVETEVLRRALGSAAPALLTGLRHPSEAGARHCERIAALLVEALALPPAERRLAIRVMFERR